MVLPTGESGSASPVNPPFQTASPQQSPLDKKIDDVSQPALKSSYHPTQLSFFAKFFKFESWIADKLDSLWGMIFPSKGFKEAQTMGLSSYQGERHEDLHFNGKSKISEHFSLPVEVDAQKSIKRQFMGLNYKDKEVPDVEIETTKWGETFKVHSQWDKDFDRTREFRVEGEKFYLQDDNLEEDEKEFLTFAAYRKLYDYFDQGAAFFNLGSIVNQTLMADLVDLLGAQLNNIVRDNRRPELITVSQERGMTIHYNEKEDDTVHVTIRLPMKVASSKEGEANQVGFIAVERKVILSKKDLNTDWRKDMDPTKPNFDMVAPSLVVVDTVSRFASTSDAAIRHLKLLTSTEPMKKPS